MRCTMKSPVRAAGWDGCWDDGTGGSRGVFSPGLLPGLWIGVALWIFKAAAAEMDPFSGLDVCDRPILGMAVFELCGVPGGHSAGHYRSTGHRVRGLGSHCWATAAAGVFMVLAYNWWNFPIFYLSGGKIVEKF